MWGAVKNLRDKLLRVDHSKLIACDIVNVITSHFEKIREAKLARFGLTNFFGFFLVIDVFQCGTAQSS